MAASQPEITVLKIEPAGNEPFRHENSHNDTAAMNGEGSVSTRETPKKVESTRETPKKESEEPMVQLSKYILLLATVVATLTYATGFSPPGGVWQDTDAAAGHLAGDPIIRDTNQTRYLVFFYFNATAFALSLVVIVLVLFLSFLYEEKKIKEKKIDVAVRLLQAVMVLDLLSIMGAYAAGTCRDTVTTVYSSLLVAIVFSYLVTQMVRGKKAQVSSPQGEAQVPPQGEAQVSPQGEAQVSSAHPNGKPSLRRVLPLFRMLGVPRSRRKEMNKKRLRKVLMLLATFAVSVTYVAGMSTPGGFWDNNAEHGHRPGDAILKDRHRARLTVFFCFNTMAFGASLLIIVVLLNRKYRVTEAYVWITVALVSLVGAYIAGSCRKTDTTVYLVILVLAVLAFIAFIAFLVRSCIEGITGGLWQKLKNELTRLQKAIEGPEDLPITDVRKEAMQARSLVLLLATLAATITYQAGLDPPGGVWPDNGHRHMAGDPILLTTNPRRYKAFFYCNSVAFVASLVAIILVQNELLLKTHVLEAAMILDLFGLIGAYAAGSCRDVTTSVYAMALAGAVLVYVVIHVVFFTLDHKEATPEIHQRVEKRRKRLLLFAVLAATITYQAGLTPPGGFRLQDDASGHHAGDPVLLYNFPRRYTAFFYCNSVSFMLSIALIILLVNPHLYRPAIRSYALAVCTGAGMFGLMGAYAAGSTQYLKTSIYIFVLVAVVLLVVVILFLVFLPKESVPVTAELPANANGKRLTSRERLLKWIYPQTAKLQAKPIGTPGEKERHAKRKYLMLLGILVASVTYQAGLEPPGGAWQQSSGGHYAGYPVLHDSNRPQYLAFFYSNSTSFVASIVVIILLLVEWVKSEHFSLRGISTAIVLDLLALLVAYAAGSSRRLKTSMYVVGLVIAVLAYVGIHIALAWLCARAARARAARPRSTRGHRQSGAQHRCAWVSGHGCDPQTPGRRVQRGGDPWTPGRHVRRGGDPRSVRAGASGEAATRVAFGRAHPARR